MLVLDSGFDVLPNQQTHQFVYNRWAARRIAGVTMVVFYCFLLLLMLGRNAPFNNVLEMIVVMIAAAVALVYIVIARHPVTRLSVGPDGISVPFGLLRPIKWDEVEKIEFVDQSSAFFPTRELLIVSFRQGIPSVARLPLPSWLDEKLHHVGLRVPLHMLRAQSTEVRTAIEAYMPVVQTDLEPKAAKISPAE